MLDKLFHRVPICLAVLFLSLMGTLSAQSNLLFFEIQGIAAYSDKSDGIHYYSHHSHEAMQKPSLGFDFISRQRGNGRDYGYLALQARLAYDQNESNRIEPQLYNAYYNYKASFGDVWLGHNKTAIGLSSYLDNHALLLTDNSMTPLNFDRDWGVGYDLDQGHRNYKLSLTTGSGMSFSYDENFLVAARVGFGDYNFNNRTLGVSLATGDILNAMGYHIMHNKMTHRIYLAGLDARIRYLNRFFKADVIAGEYDSETAYSVLVRGGMFLLPEDRLSIELQTMLTEIKRTGEENYSLALSYRVTPYYTLRALYNLQQPHSAHTAVLQIYYYRGLIF